MTDADLIDSPQAWVVAFASAAVVAVSFGTVYTFGAFFDAMAQEFETGRGLTSIVFGITAFFFFGTGAASGFLADRFGARPLVWVGGALFSGGLLATSQVNEVWHGYLTYGLGAGIGGGLFVSPVFAMIAGWFDRWRGLAQGLVATGSGVGTLILLPLSERLISEQGWRQAYVVLGVLAGVVFGLGGFFIRQPPVDPPPVALDHLREVLATATFRRLAICGALQSGSMLSAFAFIVPFANDRGISSERAALLIAIIGASSIVGRLLLTGFADRFGPVRTLQASFVVQPIAFLIWLVSDGNFGLLVIFTLVLGVAYGGFVALLPFVVAHLFGLRGLGTVMGFAFLTAGVGSLVLPPLVGFVADRAGGQALPILLVVVLSAAGATVLFGLQRGPVDLVLTAADSPPR